MNSEGQNAVYVPDIHKSLTTAKQLVDLYVDDTTDGVFKELLQRWHLLASRV